MMLVGAHMLIDSIYVLRCLEISLHRDDQCMQSSPNTLIASSLQRSTNTSNKDVCRPLFGLVSLPRLSNQGNIRLPAFRRQTQQDNFRHPNCGLNILYEGMVNMIYYPICIVHTRGVTI
jgi:hypothetical protein